VEVTYLCLTKINEEEVYYWYFASFLGVIKPAVRETAGPF